MLQDRLPVQGVNFSLVSGPVGVEEVRAVRNERLVCVVDLQLGGPVGAKTL